MIEVGVDVERVVFTKHRAELWCYTRWQGARNPSAEADHLNRGDGVKLAEEPFQPLVTEKQRIPTRYEHIPDFWMGLDVLDSFAHGLLINHHLRRADLALSGAKTTIHCTLICHEKEGSVSVLMDNAGYRTEPFFSQTIKMTDRIA